MTARILRKLYDTAALPTRGRALTARRRRRRPTKQVEQVAPLDAHLGAQTPRIEFRLELAHRQRADEATRRRQAQQPQAGQRNGSRALSEARVLSYAGSVHALRKCRFAQSDAHQLRAASQVVEPPTQRRAARMQPLPLLGRRLLAQVSDADEHVLHHRIGTQPPG